MKQITKTALAICLISLICVLLTSCGEEAAQQTTSDLIPGETNSAVAHTFVDWTTIKEATCNEAGLAQRYCSECMYTESQAIKALGHDIVQHEAKSPICELAGHEAYETCKRCDYTSTYKEISALKHTYDDKGFCTRCNDSEKFKIFVVYDSPSEYEAVIGYKSATDFADTETLTIPGYHNGTRITHVGGDLNAAGRGIYTFRGLKNLKSIIISEGIEYIEWDAFVECAQITSISIPKSIDWLDTTPFFSISKLQDIYYGGTREEWKDLLKDPCIPFAVTVHCSDGDLVLEKATESTAGLEMKKKEDGTYECIGMGTCTTNNIVISYFDGVPVTSIADEAFEPRLLEDGSTQYFHITYAALGDHVVSIGESAFADTSLKGVHLGNRLANIDANVFGYCYLTSIYYSGTVAQWNAIEKEEGSQHWDGECEHYTIYCTDGEITKQ